MQRIHATALLALCLCLFLTSCGLQAIHRYEYQNQELLVDVSADVVEYGGQTYTYVLDKNSWSITYPNGAYDQETIRDDGNRVVSSSWSYSNTPTSQGYLEADTLLSYIQDAEGGGAFYLRPLWWVGLAIFGVGTVTMLWPHWLRLSKQTLCIIARGAGAVLAFGGLGLMFY